MGDTNAWYRDPVHTFEGWQSAVANDETRQGYVDWAVAQYEQAEEAVPVALAAQVTDPAADGLIEGKAPVTAAARAQYAVGVWQSEVLDANTRLGFEAWVMHQVEANAPRPMRMK